MDKKKYKKDFSGEAQSPDSFTLIGDPSYLKIMLYHKT